MGKGSLVAATVAKLLLVLVIAYSECWQVFLSGDRCLYPSSFHLFSTYVCVGQDAAAASSHRSHGALCLPYLSDELYRLPPTDDRTLARFSVLGAALKLQGALPLLLLTLQWGSGGGSSDGAPWVAVLHLIGAFLAALAVAAVLTAPAASAAAWAAGVATCAVECQPGAALVLSAALVPLEFALAWFSLRAPSPLLGSVLSGKGKAADARAAFA